MLYLDTRASLRLINQVSLGFYNPHFTLADPFQYFLDGNPVPSGDVLDGTLAVDVAPAAPVLYAHSI